MSSDRGPSPARLRRLAEELTEAGLPLDGPSEWRSLLLEEVDAALHPHVFERRVASSGSILLPTTDPATWPAGTQLAITEQPVAAMPLADARKFADGLSSWLVRALDSEAEWAFFDRPAGSERDLVVLAEVMGATVVQRHPTGVVRVVSDFGVLRGGPLGWRLEPPIATWLDSTTACPEHGDPEVVETMLEFAVHDLGARGIGAILVYQAGPDPAPRFQVRLPRPPPLQIRRPHELAPLRHALGQVDGAAVFDVTGTLRQLGVRLVPSPESESTVAGYRGMRHTAGRRYSVDDPLSTVIVVSEDGPVTVLRNGVLLGSSPEPGG